MLSRVVTGFLATYVSLSPMLVPPPANTIVGNASVSGTLTVNTIATGSSTDLTLSVSGTNVKINTGKRYVMDDNNDENDYITCTANDNCRIVVGGAAIVTMVTTTSAFGTAISSTSTMTSSRTSDLGWAVVDGTDNTICNTQCTSAAVFGFDLAAGATAPVIVGPADATADICLCAGSS